MHAAVVWDLFHMFVSAIEVGLLPRTQLNAPLAPLQVAGCHPVRLLAQVFLVPSKQGAPLRAEWLELLVERLYFILAKFLNLMRRDLGAPGLPPKPDRPKLDDLLAQAVEAHTVPPRATRGCATRAMCTRGCSLFISETASLVHPRLQPYSSEAVNSVHPRLHPVVRDY